MCTKTSGDIQDALIFNTCDDAVRAANKRSDWKVGKVELEIIEVDL